MAKSRIVKLSQTLSFNSTGTATERIALPRTRIDQLTMHIDYTVTDTGISAGENMAGAMTQLILGNESAPLIDVRQNEVGHVIDMMTAGISTGLYSDDQPTTETAQHAYFTLTGPFQMASYDKPELIVTLNPIGEFGGATAFVATVYVTIVLSRMNEQQLPGARIWRYAGGSGVNHSLPLGPGIVKDILLVSGTASNIKELRLAAMSAKGGRSDSDYDLFSTYPRQFIDEWARFKTGSVATTKYFIPALDAVPYVGRVMEIELTASGAVTLFARNIQE